MFIGLDMFGGLETYDAFNVVNRYTSISLGRFKVDEVWIDQNVEPALTTLKEEWGFYTTLLAQFQNNLEAGSLANSGIPVEYLKIRKRRADQLAWVDIVTIPFDPEQGVYSHIDRIARAGELYDYMVIPVTNDVAGSSLTEQIECSFDSTFLVDNDYSYQLLYDLEYDPIENVSPSAVIETFSKYPTVAYSGQVDYQRGSIKCMILSDQTVSSGQIDSRQERLNRDNLMRFLKNKKPKVLKDSSGRYLMVTIVGNPQEIPNNSLNQRVSGAQFEWVEIGSLEEEKLS